MGVKAYLALVVLVVVAESCSKTEYKTTLMDRGIRVDCYLKRVEVCESSGNDGTTFSTDTKKQSTVYGRIELTNQVHEEVTYNLKKYNLVFGDRISSRLYIDSFVDYLLTDKVLGPDQHLSRDVYWVFDGEITTSDLGRLELAKMSEP